MSHTKLPWHYVSIAGIIGNIEDSQHNQICQTSERQRSRGIPLERIANAAFIVKAANSHYELVAALEAMTSMWNSVCKANGHDPLHMGQYEDAIALLGKVRS